MTDIVSPIITNLPPAAAGKGGSTDLLSMLAAGNGLTGPSPFAALLSAKKAGSAKTGGGAADALLTSQLSALLERGAPMATIVQQISAEIAKLLGNHGAVPKHPVVLPIARPPRTPLGNAGASPPNTGPPNPAAVTQAEALTKHLRRLITELVSDQQTAATAGQQSRFPGQILDAASAKDIPAQQTNTATGLMPGAASLVESTLAALAGALAAASPTAAQAPSARPIHADPLRAPQTPAPGAPVPGEQSARAASGGKPAAGQAQVPDVLARMVARAASANQRLPVPPLSTIAFPSGHPADAGAGNPSSSVVQAAPESNKPSVTALTLTPAQVMQRLAAVIAEHTAQDGSTDSRQPESRQSPSGLPARSSGSPLTPISFGAAFSAQTASAAHAADAASGQASASSGSTADPQSVIEQVVKSIAIFQPGNGTSQVRLHLQPEHLGDVTLRLTVQGNSVCANVVAQNADVRQVLMANQQQLARTLADAGLTLGGFSVDVSGGNSDSSSQGQTPQPRTVKSVANGRAFTVDEEPIDPRTGPPILANSPWAFSYLA